MVHLPTCMIDFYGKCRYTYMYVYMNGMVVTSGIVMSILGSSPKKYVSPCHPETGPLVSSHGVFWNSAPSDYEAECNSHFFKKHPTKKMHVAPNFNGNSWEVNVTRIPLNCQFLLNQNCREVSFAAWNTLQKTGGFTREWLRDYYCHCNYGSAHTSS